MAVDPICPRFASCHFAASVAGESLNPDSRAADQRVGGIDYDAVGRSHTRKNFDGLSEVATDLDRAQFDRCVRANDADLQALGAKQQGIGGQGQGRIGVVSAQADLAIAVGQDFVMRVVHLEFGEQRPGSRAIASEVVMTFAANTRPGLAGVVSMAVWPGAMPSA